MSMPTLTVVPDAQVPDAVKSAPLPEGIRVAWTLKAEFPTPHGTVFLRYSAPEDGDDELLVLTTSGKALQRLRDTGWEKKAPKTLQALWLAPREKKGPLLQLDHFRLAFPEGFSGLCSLNDLSATETKFAWNGLHFVEEALKSAPDADAFAPPLSLPKPKYGGQTRFGAAIFGGRRYFLRFAKAGPLQFLEIATTSGKTLAVHRLESNFAGAEDTSLSALWLDDKRKLGPVLVARDSDTVRVHVFTEGLAKLLCAQNFSDSSSSISATTVEFSRDKRGQLIVSENYSEREGGGHTTDYVWAGDRFREVK